MLTPKNTQYNRQLNLLGKFGKILTQKNGLVYFYFEINEKEKVYFKCDENIFKKQFDVKKDEVEEVKLPAEQLEAALKKCKNYPH